MTSSILRKLSLLNRGVVRRHVLSTSIRKHDYLKVNLRPFASNAPSSQLTRRDAIRDAKPFSDFLTDSFGRQHDYLRISLTERCNLRCLYCMPEEGIELSPDKDLLTSAEIYHLSALFVRQGITKIRLTGGEPTVRKDIVPLLRQLGSLRKHGLRDIAMTTNGISLHRKLDDMVEAGLTAINISLDTLDPYQFQLLTRRQGFHAVMKSIDKVKDMNTKGAGIKLKINCVVMRELNDHQIVPFVEMTRDDNIEVRFIEYMPFGGNKWSKNKMMSYSDILNVIQAKYPDIRRMEDEKNETSKTWQVPSFVGRVGFITSMTHNFCSSCNRLRITSDGNIKVCLHGQAEVSLRDILRKCNDGEPLEDSDWHRMPQALPTPASQFTDRTKSWSNTENELLEVIGAAVKVDYGEQTESCLSMKYLNDVSHYMSPSQSHVIECRRSYDGDADFASVPTEISLRDESHPLVSYVRSQLFLPSFNIPRAAASEFSVAPRSKSLSTKGRRPEITQLGSPTMSALAAQRHACHSYESRRHSSSSSDESRGTRGWSKSIENVDILVKNPTTGDAQVAIRCDDEKPCSTSSSLPSRYGTRLTHVNSTGEAHMVDVGSKGASHRVAIAQGRVRFSNPKSVWLIQENRNKKGDVLGTSRIAGIMAAKRAADLIPLCHPVSISKAFVEIRILSHQENKPNAEEQFGLAIIQARVDCVGVTGVEMEALTAVAVAALTIYDMCKAVDKRMVIEQARLVYKTGGKGGDFVEEEWFARGGREYIASSA